MEAKPKTSRRNTVRAVVAWVGTAALLAFLYFTTDIPAAAEAFRHADLATFAITALVAVFLTYMTDVGAVRLLLARVGIKVPFGEFVRIKGASYLLNIVNYNLGLVMMAAVVKKRSSKGWGAAGSPFILLNFIDLSVFSLIIQAAVWTGKSPFPKLPTMILAFLTAGGVAGAPILCLASRWKSAPGKIGRILNSDILAAFRYLEWKSLLLVTGLRMVLILEYGAMNYFFMKSFGAVVPPLQLLFFMSILSFIAMVPVSVSGIGSTQVVMRDFYGPYVADGVAPTLQGKVAVVDAFSTAGIFGVLIIRIFIGLACMPWVSKYIAESSGDKEPD